jgi:hypothetical protein
MPVNYTTLPSGIRVPSSANNGSNVAAGLVTMANDLTPPRATYLGDPVQLTANTWRTLILVALTTNATGGIFTRSGNSMLTSQAGLYRVSATVIFDSGTATAFNLRLSGNDADLECQETRGAVRLAHLVSTPMELSANSPFTLQAFTDGSGSPAVFAQPMKIFVEKLLA